MTTVQSSQERFLNALAGGSPVPSVAGLTFVAPQVLERATALEGAHPGETLALACSRAGLDFAVVEATAPWSTRAVELLHDDGRAVVWAVDGLLASAYAALGVETALRASARAPRSLGVVFDHRLTEAAAEAERGIELEVDAIMICEDLAGSDGPLVAPDFANEMLMPRLGALARLGELDGIAGILHTDGDARVFFEAADHAGFTGVHAGGGLDEERFETAYWAARRAGLVVIGGAQSIAFGQGPHAAIRSGHRLGLLAAAGGLIVADDGGITTPEQAEEALTILATAVGA